SPIQALVFYKFSCYLISIGSFISLYLFLVYVNLFILGWSAKFQTTHANSAFLAEFTVFTCPIDSIDQYGLRIISMSFFILFNRVPQPGAFVVGIPRQHIQKSISTYEADR